MIGLQIDVIQVTAWVQNCMLLSTGEHSPAVVVDPGGDPDAILGAVERRKAKVAGILVTHGHIDHIGALPEMVAATAAPVWLHPEDLWLFENPGMGRTAIPVPADAVRVADGDVVDVAGLRFEVLHTPGHSPGHVCFRTRTSDRDLLIGGDLLFAGSIGRTDLPRGDFDQLVASVTTKVWPLPDETVVLPGHGPHTTVGFEKRTNPYVSESALRG